MVDEFLEVGVVLGFVGIDVVENAAGIFDAIVLIVGEIAGDFFGHGEKVEFGTFLGFVGEDGEEEQAGEN